MERIIPMSWLNQILLVFSIVSTLLCLLIHQWTDFIPFPLYVSISLAVFITFISVWFSCFLLRLSLKANSPINIEFLNKLAYKWLERILQLNISKNDKTDMDESDVRKESSKDTKTSNLKNKSQIMSTSSNGERVSMTKKRKMSMNDMIKDINLKCIDVWYKNISNEKTFPDETQELLRKLLIQLFWKVELIDKVKLTNKLANVLLLHLKEYRRALRRVQKGFASNIEEAYKCLHPGSRSTPALEHMLHRLVTVLAQEFLQWELTSSLPCKLLLSVLAKRLLIIIETISCPNWIFENILSLLQISSQENTDTEPKQNGIISVALSGGITSATAAVIPRPIPKSVSDTSPLITVKNESKSSLLTVNSERPSLHLEGLAIEHKGLWGDSISGMESETDEDRVSPVYEEPTDFATTIARLRTLLQQKSTATTPLLMEEKSYVIYEGSQFTNLSIPWTEFHTASDGSQQLFYCIQFDDVEQRGVDLFETTTATVRRQYSDFAQLHASLEEIPSLAGIMSNLVLPEGGRVELENYLKTLCTRLANECPPQLRHFLRPNSNAGKKADAVAPRFDKFLAKTVSGVFNTLKTVVPGFEMDQEEEPPPLPTLMPLADIPWRFVEDIKSKSLVVELQQLVAERTDYCSVDTAYEAVDSMEGEGDPESLTHWWETVNTNYEEEADELDSNLTLTCAAIDLICELLTGIGSNNTLQQEVVVRWTKLLLGNITEPIIQKAIFWIFEHVSNLPFTRSTQNNGSKESMEQLKEKILQILEIKIPYDVKLIFGQDDIRKILKYILNSCEIKKINMDLNMQTLDVLTSQLLISCRINHDSLSP